MATKKDDATKASNPAQVQDYLQQLDHPLADVVKALRQIILDADPRIGEEIKWNAPAFFFTGSMPAFNPKDYKRHIIVFNLHQKNAIRLVFLHGADIPDASGLLSGDYADGRRLAQLGSTEEVETRKADLQAILRSALSLYL